MTTANDVVLVKLGLSLMASEHGEKAALALFTNALNAVAEQDIVRMCERLKGIKNMGPVGALQLMAQLGWLLAQLIDNGGSPVVY